ncbi:MAG: DUF502 domain-containing protein [Halobacteriales archaeon]|nr:DUF502 domain-containing protein [Halobacteriales archaeon]
MKARLKRNIVSGIVVITPLAVSAYVVYWIYERVASLPGTQYFEITESPIVNELIQFGFAVVIITVVLAVTGYAVRTATGVLLKDEMDRLASRIPIVRIIYNATKMGIETLVGSSAEELDRPVKIEVAGLRVTGFKTGNTTDDGRVVVFVPTSPNITSGYVVDIEPEKVQETNEGVEEALTRVLSAGFGMESEEKDRIENLLSEESSYDEEDSDGEED